MTQVVDMRTPAADVDPRDARIAELEEENARLRAELARIRKRRTAYAGRRDAARSLGTWEPFADCEEVRAHVEAVTRATGITVNGFANIAGVNWLTVGSVMSGSREKIRTVSAEKILAVTADTVRASGSDAHVDATGAVRRLRALAVRGWSLREIERRSGVSYAILQLIRDGQKTLIAVKTRRKITAVYRELANTEPPCETRSEKVSAGRTRSAANPGWAPPGAWDEDFIDDPGAEPRWDWVRGPERKNHKGPELAEDIRDLRASGLSLDAAADRLGISRSTVDKTLARYPQPGEGGEVA